MNFANKKVAILGYGIEGEDAEKFFKSRGADTTILDQKFDKNYLSNLDKYDLIVRSPGVYPLKNELSDLNVITPTQIFLEEFKGTTIGVTGTKGKGTTSTLIYEILKANNADVYLAGNIGKPLLSLLEKLNSKSTVVMEMSSFQLFDLKKSPNIAVVLNITSDHMDWHKDINEYINAKRSIVKYQSKSDWAVLNAEYKTSKEFEKNTNANVIYFSKKTLEEKFKKDLQLRGEHNLENIAASVAVSKILNLDQKVVESVIKDFKGLEHRLEFVRSVNGIGFYNDSFATGPQPTIAAIKSFTEPMTIILGGSDKGLDYTELGNEIENIKNIKNIILIGTTAIKIKKVLNKDSKFNIYDLGFATMKEIVSKAFEVTSKGGVVILSPASASFDMFENYKDRGSQFKKTVLQLK